MNHNQFCNALTDHILISENVEVMFLSLSLRLPIVESALCMIILHQPA